MEIFSVMNNTFLEEYTLYGEEDALMQFIYSHKQKFNFPPERTNSFAKKKEYI